MAEHCAQAAAAVLPEAQRAAEAELASGVKPAGDSSKGGAAEWKRLVRTYTVRPPPPPRRQAGMHRAHLLHGREQEVAIG